MISNFVGVGVLVLGGFVILVDVYREFFEVSGLNNKIYFVLDKLDVSDVNQFVEVGREIC